MGAPSVPGRLACAPGTAHLWLAGAEGAALTQVLRAQIPVARSTGFISWSTTDLGGFAPLRASFPQLYSGDDNGTCFLLVIK